MKSRIFVTALALVGLGIIDAQTANAAPQYFDAASSGVWNLAANWNARGCDPGDGAGAVPIAGDVAIICEEKVVTLDVNTAALGGLYVRVGAAVVFDEFTMIIESSDLGSSEVEGEIRLNHSDSKLRFITNDAILGGDGKIVGTRILARLEVEGATVTLTSYITIEGLMKITKLSGGTAGTFVNNGEVFATGGANAGDILLLEELTFARGHRGVYRVKSSDHADAGMQFGTNAVATDLSSDFRVEAGTLDVDVNLSTSGTLYYSGGTVDCSQSGVVCVFADAEAH